MNLSRRRESESERDRPRRAALRDDQRQDLLRKEEKERAGERGS